MDYFKHRQNLTLNRILSGDQPRFTPDFVAADAIPNHHRRFTEFSGDVSGRYIEALSRLDLAPAVRKSLDALVARILKFQKPDGFFGDPGAVTAKETRMSRFWGNGRLLVGLTAYVEKTGNAKALAAAARLGNHFLDAARVMNTDAVQKAHSGLQGAVGYICWTQIIEGLVPLARLTRDDRYLDLAKQIAKRHRHHEAQHTHGYLCALRGMVDLAMETDDDGVLAQVRGEWDWMAKTGNVMPWGAVGEYFKPKTARDEGCTEADWLRLNLDLFSATGDPRFLESAELALWNGFAYNQFQTGDFGHHTWGRGGCCGPSARAWWCCTFHGLRALPEVGLHALTATADGFALDLAVSSSAESPLAKVTCDGTLEKDGRVVFTVEKTRGEAWTLAVRAPDWARQVTARLGNRNLRLTGKGSYRIVHRIWKRGDRIEIRFDFKTVLVPHPDTAGTFAIMHGPWFLGVNEACDPGFFDEPHQKNVVSIPLVRNASIQLKSPPKQDRTVLATTIPAGHLVLPYLPGGYPVQPQTATLRPIAEQTGFSDHNAWVWWFTTTPDRAKDIPKPV